MMMFGSDASTCGAQYCRNRQQPKNEVTTTTVPARHHRPISPAILGLGGKRSGWFFAPLELSFVSVSQLSP